MTTVWSGDCSLEYILELLSRSRMHSDLETYLDLNCFSEERFLPSLFPRWL